jgi:hypothetical protein
MQRKWYRSVLEKDIDAVNGMFVLIMCETFSLIRYRPDQKEGG